MEQYSAQHFVTPALKDEMSAIMFRHWTITAEGALEEDIRGMLSRHLPECVKVVDVVADDGRRVAVKIEDSNGFVAWIEGAIS